MDQSPLLLTTDGQLEASVERGWDHFAPVAKRRGAEAVARWLTNRLSGDLVREEVDGLVETMLDQEAELPERALAMAELAELIEELDTALEVTLWEGVLTFGYESDDAEIYAEAINRLAALHEAAGDPLTAAEYQIQFLNWRRMEGHASSPDQVLDAFDEVIRLAVADKQMAIAARYEHAQARYSRLVDMYPEQASEGDWEGTHSSPYESWE